MSMTMKAEDLAATMTKPLSRQLLGSSIPARFAYTALDGGPRVVPIGFDWDGRYLTVGTLVGAPKVEALRADPRVAITIDTEGFPPQVLLIRGTAEIEIVDGVPDVYLRASKKIVPLDQQDSWEAGVRALYRQMAVIRTTPTWAKLIDFDTTLPQAVQDLLSAQADPSSSNS